MKSLYERAKEKERIFSNPNREFNTGKETFHLQKIMPHSDSVASAVYMKKPSGKLAIIWFFNVKDWWCDFFPTDSHYAALHKLGEYREALEAHNSKLELEEIKREEKKQTVSGATIEPDIDRLLGV